MVEISIKNLLKLPQLFKILELVVTLVLLLLYRVPNCGGYVDSVDALYFASLVYIGFFFLCILQIISILGGDKSPILDVLIAIFGFIFYLSIGAYLISKWHGISKAFECAKKAKALGSLSIIASFLYLADTAFGAFAVMKANT